MRAVVEEGGEDQTSLSRKCSRAVGLLCRCFSSEFFNVQAYLKLAIGALFIALVGFVRHHNRGLGKNSKNVHILAFL